MALAHGYALPFEALRRTGVLSQNTADATNRATADGATKEAAGGCLDARALEVQQRAVVQPSILVVPQLTRNGVVLNQLPDTRTNFIQNNTMVGATGSVRPNLWDLGSLPSGFTVSYSASGQTTAADGTLVDYIDVTVSGTALASGFLNLRQTTSPSPVSGNLLFASGMTYTASVYLALLSGSLTGVATNAMALQEIANTTFVANATFAPVTGITSALTRFSGTRPIDATGGADRVSVRWGHSITSGTSYDYTVRIASPQLEKGSIATPLIRTASGFVTVDMLGVARDGAPPDFTFTRATTATRVNASGLIESVASGVLRLDYPIGGGCPAALIEASGTNLAFHSESWVSGNNWTLTDSTNVTGATSAPNGNATANALSPTAASSSHFVFSNGTTTVSYTSGTIYTQSAFFKAGTGAAGQFVQLTFPSARFTQTGYANFDLIAGTVSVVSGSSADANRAARIENYGDGWYRCIFTATCNSTGTGAGLIIALITSTGSSRIPSFSGVTGDVLYGWGAQVETGSIPTSYIPTTTGSATRNADVCTVSGVSGYIGQTEGTIYAEVDIRAINVEGYIIRIGLASFDNTILFTRSSANNLSATIRQGASNIFSGATSGLGAGRFKIALAYSNNSHALYVNGNQIATGTTALSYSVTLSDIRLGGFSDTTALFNDRLRAAAIYTTRLSNDQLANITRLT